MHIEKNVKIVHDIRLLLSDFFKNRIVVNTEPILRFHIRLPISFQQFFFINYDYGEQNQQCIEVLCIKQ